MAATRAVDPVERLKEEYKAWQHNHPKDFIANPVKKDNEETDWLTWNCDSAQGDGGGELREIEQIGQQTHGLVISLPTRWLLLAIPGPKKTFWEGGLYKLELSFPQDYPFSPPNCVFNPVILHPNVFPSGKVSLSLIDKNKGWKPQVTTKEVLLGIQLLLSEPNFQDPAQAEAYVVYSQSRMEYEERVKKQAKEMAPNGLG